jgi:ribosomal protein S18 acetylase RimI-like enzyme
MPMILRPVEQADIPWMAAIRAQGGTAAFWKDRIGLYLSGQHSPQQALTARAAFVAIDRNDLVGFVVGHRTRGLNCDGELQWINVVKERRGLGVASQLMTKISTWFVDQDARRICVNVDPNNSAARKLYTRHGAQPLNDHWMVWEDARAMSISADV